MPPHKADLLSGGLVQEVVLPDVPDGILKIPENLWQRQGAHLLVQPLGQANIKSPTSISIRLPSMKT
jgi:hypothetical protein